VLSARYANEITYTLARSRPDIIRIYDKGRANDLVYNWGLHIAENIQGEYGEDPTDFGKT